MLDTLRQIAIFAKTVDHGSFRGAAESLRLSPSVVSYHVKQLEERLGTALIYRSTRRLSLTPDGEQLLESAHAMLQSAERGLQRVARHSEQLSGLLRVTVPAFLAGTQLSARFAAFTHANPHVRVSLEFSDTVQDVIADGYDMAIRVGDMKDSALEAQKLCDLRRVLVVTPAYAATRETPQRPKDLEAWHWLELAPVWFKKPEFVRDGKRVVLANRESRMSVNSATAMSHLVCAGAGLAIVPECLVADDLAAGRLQTVLPDWQLDGLTAYAVWPANAPRNGLIKHVVTALLEPGMEEPLSRDAA
ncbi:MAG: LysR family transcriptional regulator [Pseudomonadota bacterium]